MPRCLYAALWALVTLPGVLHACSCVHFAGPCDQGWKSGDVIFLGRVVSITLPPGADPNVPTSKIAHFVISDGFRGTVDAGKEAIVYTGSGAGDCGYPFEVGVSYLVYATPRKDGFETGICSETAPAVRVGGALRELRALRDHAVSDDLFGTLALHPRGNGWADLVDSQPLRGVPVTAVEKTGRRFSAISDDSGAYAFTKLPAARYRIEVNLPAGLVSGEKEANRQYPLDLPVHGEQRTGCRADSFPLPDGRISGRVIEATTGKPAKGFISVKYLDQEKVPERNSDMGPGYDVENNKGEFELLSVFPGRFVLEFRPASRFGEPILWPNGNGMELLLGQHLDHVRIQVAQQ